MMRTRIWPSPSAGSSTSPISKVSAVGSPLGRLAKRTCRLFIGGSSLGWNAEIGADQFGRLLAAHDRRGVGVVRDHGRKERKSVVKGRSVSVRVDLGGCRSIKKKIHN